MSKKAAFRSKPAVRPNQACAGLAPSTPATISYDRKRAAWSAAVIALGVGLVWSFAQQPPTEEAEDRVRQFELKRALVGPKVRLDEVLSELGLAV